MQQKSSYKCILTGEPGIGKSHIIYRIVKNTFGLQYQSSIEPPYYTKELIVKKKNIQLQIWDNAGAERYRNLPPIYYRGTAGLFLVYDLTNRHSFNNIAKWLDEGRKNCDANVSIILIGNKFDMENERVVSYEEGERFAKENGLIFFEVSTKTPYNVTEMENIFIEKVYCDFLVPSLRISSFYCNLEYLFDKKAWNKMAGLMIEQSKNENHGKSGVKLQNQSKNASQSGNCAC